MFLIFEDLTEKKKASKGTVVVSGISGRVDQQGGGDGSCEL